MVLKAIENVDIMWINPENEKKITENQEKYDNEMVTQSQKTNLENLKLEILSL